MWRNPLGSGYFVDGLCVFGLVEWIIHDKFVVSTSNLLAIPQSGDAHRRAMIAIDAVIDDSV